MNKNTPTGYAVFLSVMFFLFILSSSAYSQEHPLSGSKYGSLIFMKKSTADKQDNFLGDTMNYMEVPKGTIPEIWVRAFLKNNVQHYVDNMKKIHTKIQNMNFLFAYTIESVLYIDGKEQVGNSTTTKSYSEKINVEKFTDLSVNTVQFKFSDFQNFVSFFNFQSSCIKANNQMRMFKISCTLKFQCNYVDVIEKTRTDYYKSSEGSDILAIKSEEVDILKYNFFKLVFK